MSELRPPRDDDFDAILALLNAHQLAAFGEASETAEELRNWLTSPSVEPARDIRLLEREGRLVGYADVDPTGAEPRLWWCDVKLDPQVNAGETLSVLVGWLEERAQEGVLRVWTAARDDRVVNVFEELGFAVARHSYRMEIDLDGSRREPKWPTGISVRTVTPDDERLAYDLVLEVWRDTWDPMDETFEEWQHWTTSTPAYDQALWFFAIDGKEVVGFSFCREDPNDPRAGHVATLGVRRPWRRQGLGEALLQHSFGEFARRGYGRATLGVDVASPTGALRLYERAGMTTYRDTVFLERPVRA